MLFFLDRYFAIGIWKKAIICKIIATKEIIPPIPKAISRIAPMRYSRAAVENILTPSTEAMELKLLLMKIAATIPRIQTTISTAIMDMSIPISPVIGAPAPIMPSPPKTPATPIAAATMTLIMPMITAIR